MAGSSSVRVYNPGYHSGINNPGTPEMMVVTKSGPPGVPGDPGEPGDPGPSGPVGPQGLSGDTVLDNLPSLTLLFENGLI